MCFFFFRHSFDQTRPMTAAVILSPLETHTHTHCSSSLCCLENRSPSREGDRGEREKKRREERRREEREEEEERGKGAERVRRRGEEEQREEAQELTISTP